MVSLTAPLSDVAIANFAVATLDDYPITTLDDNTSVGRFMARHYTYVRDELLQMYPASFARNRKAIAADEVAPAFGWRYAYTLPDDCIRLLPITCDGTLNGVMVPYELEGRTVLTNAQAPLKVRYIRRVTNAADFTPLFGRLLGARLAVLGATRITGKSSYFQKAGEAFNAALADFKLEDSLSAGTTEKYDYAGDEFAGQYRHENVRGVGL